MKQPKRLGEPIASRQLLREGSGQPIQVFVWKPFKESDETWACPYQIKGFGDEVVRYAHGVDAMQALQLSFDGLRANLNPQQNRIYWEGPEIADAGLPRTIPYSYNADTYHYLCGLMDREVGLFPHDPRRSVKALRARAAKWKAARDAGPTKRGRKNNPKGE